MGDDGIAKCQRTNDDNNNDIVIIVVPIVVSVIIILIIIILLIIFCRRRRKHRSFNAQYGVQMRFWDSDQAPNTGIHFINDRVVDARYSKAPVDVIGVGVGVDSTTNGNNRQSEPFSTRTFTQSGPVQHIFDDDNDDEGTAL